MHKERECQVSSWFKGGINGRSRRLQARKLFGTSKSPSKSPESRAQLKFWLVVSKGAPWSGFRRLGPDSAEGSTRGRARERSDGGRAACCRATERVLPSCRACPSPPGCSAPGRRAGYNAGLRHCQPSQRLNGSRGVPAGG